MIDIPSLNIWDLEQNAWDFKWNVWDFERNDWDSKQNVGDGEHSKKQQIIRKMYFYFFVNGKNLQITIGKILANFAYLPVLMQKSVLKGL